MTDRHYSHGLKCSKCAKPIVNHSAYGKCHACFMVEFNKDPEQIKRRSEGARRVYRENPEILAKRQKTINRNRSKALADPEVYARLQEHGRRMAVNFFTPEAIAKKIAARPLVAQKISATKLSWCPPEYREEYRALRKQRRRISTAQAREIVLTKAANEAALKHIPSALDYLRHYAPVAVLENGYRYGNAVLTPAEVIERAKTRGWQPDRWAA